MKSIVVPIIGIKFSSRFEAFQILAGTIDFNSDNFGHFGGPIKLQDRITYFSYFFYAPNNNTAIHVSQSS